jgi:hypothetical protein
VFVAVLCNSSVTTEEILSFKLNFIIIYGKFEQIIKSCIKLLLRHSSRRVKENYETF